MKTSTIIWYIVIAIVLYYLIYKAYMNYKSSGSIFKSSVVTNVVTNTTSGSTTPPGYDPNILY